MAVERRTSSALRTAQSAVDTYTSSAFARGIALERAWVHGYDARPARHADEHAGDDNLGGNLREDTHVVMSNAWASGSGGEPCAVALCRQHRAVETRKS